MKSFEQDGNSYKMKPQYMFSILLLGGLAGLFILGFVIHVPALSWIVGITAVLVGIQMMTKSFVIDMDRKEIRVKLALLRPPVTVSLADIDHFELHSVSQLFITINASLNLYYYQEGKEKIAPLAQGFTVRSMQRLLNDIEEIIGRHGY